MTKVINLLEVRKSLEEKKLVKAKRVDAYQHLEEAKQSDAAEYNYRFYQLVDLFMQEHYPDYVWKWNVWLDKIEKK